MNFLSPERLAILEALLPVLIVLGGALLVLAVDFILRPSSSRAPLEVVANLVLLGAMGWLVRRMSAGPSDPLVYGALREDPLSRFVSLAILAATLLFVLLSSETIARRGLRAAEFLSLALFASGSMMLMTMSVDFIAVFLTLEMMSLALYVLVGMTRTDLRANEAAVKYFVSGSFASAFLLLGMTFVYGATGSMKLVAMGRGGEDSLAMLGLALMLVGLAFKVGSVPFHFWVPDVYQGAPTAVTAYMSVAVKASAFAVVLRVLLGSFGTRPEAWTDPVWAIAVGTMVLGNVLAVQQRSVKRMLAYSSIAHTGYALVGVLARSTEATVFYLFVYTFMTLGAFAFVLHAGRGDEADRFEDYRGFARKRPWSAFAMTLFLISLGGIPPTAGFFGKFALFQAAIAERFYALVIIGVMASAVSLYYYLRLVVLMYMEPGDGAEPETSEESGRSWAVALCALFVLLLGLFPSACLRYAQEAARLLLK